MQATPVPQEAATGVPEGDAGTLTFTPLGRGYRLTLPVQGKMVADLFDPTYGPQDRHAGRRRAALGERRQDRRCRTPPSTPSTEYLAVDEEATAPQLGDATQLWRITHDGTQSHSVAFGGFDVQVVERARRDGASARAGPGRAGLEGHVRVDPLESVLIAVRPVLAQTALQAAGQRAGPRRDARTGRQGRVHGARPGDRGPSADTRSSTRRPT